MLPGIGIFGTGKIVYVLVPCFRTRGFRVEAIWGRTQEDAEKVAEQLDIPFSTNKVDEVLLRKDVDLVCIVCSPHLHSQITVKALGIGKHVLCDKPAGLSQNEVLKMVRAAQYYPSLISVLCHSLRFLPVFIQMKKAIDEGYIGEITVCDIRVQCGSLLHKQYDWMCEEVMGGGILTNVGSHIIDVICYLTSKRAVKVHGMIRTYTKTTEHIHGIRQISSDDFCTFQMELEGGSCSTVTLNNHLPGQFNQEVLVCGTKGHVAVRGGDLYGQKKGSVKEDVLFLDVEDLKYSPKCMKGASSSSLLAETPDGLNTNNMSFILPKLYLKGFVKIVSALREAFISVQDKQCWVKEPVAMAATFEDGQYIQAVIDALRKSSKNKEWVKVEMLTEEIPDSYLPLGERQASF
ncbi:glucose-fructose oxidoreductase domain-containing protein 1-like isoform X2 [Limulus polyphemus]|uniref:Glucose-fructose oxidoreductase domain-containing protein 1-like isoform X1 n=1 Tax=Limulus polyphemus TaxID=6850 RepID=A0ABM1S1A0_LIMPO|nr:glucose-fructose oxidoreductase domain-containing protein 1-like isoform X1 [Limulus polyphemus]XP_022237406.1 glucose-fructose oxidoreductase domain-containing protein 1-like isoform X2 [Limulus polyphemus]